MKKITSFFWGLFFVTSIAYAQNYPNPVGHVNDFANIIDVSTEHELEHKLRNYRESTSIEIAVATVNSLEGMDVADYAVGLFNKWGVGDANKDNGILLLVAPNEREMRIEVGYGMEPDLTDIQAGRVINNDMIPYFKDGKMVQGIVAGVDAVLSQLGNTPFETRLEERRLAEEKRQAKAKRRAEESAVIMKFAGMVLAVVLVVGTPIVLTLVSIRKKKKLQAQFETNSETITDCCLYIIKAEDNSPNAVSNLAELKKICPKEVWGIWAEAVAMLPANVESAKKRADDAIKLNEENGWRKSKETATVVTDLLATIVALAGLSEDIRRKISNIQGAKDKSPRLLKETFSNIRKVKDSKALEHEDVSEKAREYLLEAENKCVEAQKLMSSSGLINWLVVLNLLTVAAQLVEKSKDKAESDKDEAEEARRPKPVYVPSPSFRSTGSDSTGSDSSSSGGSSFSGFGGGGSGGGGASGKW